MVKCKNKNRLILIGLAIIMSVLVGCTTYEESSKFKAPLIGVDGGRHSQSSMLFAKKTYDAVDNLIERSQVSLEKDQPIVVASVVNVSDLEKSSSLGRMMTEQIAGRVVQRGYEVIEPKFRNTFAINKSGEQILSRNPDMLKQFQTVQAVISGTYAAGRDSVHVNLKLIEPKNGRVLSASDFVIPASDWIFPDARVLLKD